MAFVNRPRVFTGRPFSSRIRPVESLVSPPGTATNDRRLPAPNAMTDEDFGLAFQGLEIPPGVRLRSSLSSAGIPRGEELLPDNIHAELDKRLLNWINTLDNRTLYDVAIRAFSDHFVNGPRDIVQIEPERLKNILFKNLVFTAPAKGS